MAAGGEGRLWEKLQPLMMAEHLDPVRVENGLDEGTPDVNYVQGWVELKHADMPAREGTRVDIGWRRGQRAWLGRRWEAGGCAFLLVQVGGIYILLDGWTVACLTLEENFDALRALALWTGSRLSDDRLLSFLRADTDKMIPANRARWYRARSRQTAEELAEDIGSGWTAAMVHMAETDLSIAPELTADLLEHWEV